MVARSAFVEGIGAAPTALLADGTVLPRHSLLDAEVARVIGLYDHVTRLPNRLQFIEDFRLLRGRGNRLLMLLTLVDSAQYGQILRALGPSFADDFVRAGAAQLGQLTNYEFNIYHVGTFAFALVIDHIAALGPPDLAARLVSAFADSIDCAGIPLRARPGLGLFPLDETGREAEEALRAALAAAQEGRSRPEGFALYEHNTDLAHKRALRLLTDLPGAIASGDQLDLFFQPRIALDTGHCLGAEGLLRWRHPQLGMISPSEFLPLAEQTTLIRPITDWVLGKAVRAAAQFEASGKDLRVSINVPGCVLRQAEFVDNVLSACAEASLPPDRIEVELAETGLSGDFALTAIRLDALRQAGITVCIDDFGSGTVGMANIAQIPADIVKLDQSLIRPLGNARAGAFLVRQMIGLLQGLGFAVCAEGVETHDALTLLRNLGCEQAQGYLLAPPMAVTDFDLWHRSTY